MGCDPGLNERGKGKKLLECFQICLLLDPPSYEKPLPATTVGFPKALPTRPSHHNGWYPLNHGRKETFPSLASCWLFTKKGGLIQGKWQCDTLAPSDCSISPIPRQTAIPASEKKNKSQDSIYPLKRQRPKDNWTVIQMPCLHCL